MKQGIALPKFGGTGLGAEIAVGTVRPLAFKASPQIHRTDLLALPAVSAGFFRVGKLHCAGELRLQQHLDQRIGAAFFTEAFLIAYKQEHKTTKERQGNSNDWKIAGHRQFDLVIQGLEKGDNHLGQNHR